MKRRPRQHRNQIAKRMIAGKAWEGIYLISSHWALGCRILVCDDKNKGRERSCGNWMIAQSVRACTSQAGEKRNYI